MLYRPPAFAEDRPEVLLPLLARYPFATLVSHAGDGLVATHAPVLFDAERNVLEGHVARPNPHGAALAEGARVLAIFHGPHAYVSPTWYRVPGPNVPTWNYVAVHVEGRAQAVEDEARLDGILTRLSLVFEGETGWRYDGLPTDYRDRMRRGITGFEIAVERIEGKRKLSQNRGAEDRAGVVAGLTAAGDAESLALAALMG